MKLRGLLLCFLDAQSFLSFSSCPYKLRGLLDPKKREERFGSLLPLTLGLSSQLNCRTSLLVDMPSRSLSPPPKVRTSSLRRSTDKEAKRKLAGCFLESSRVLATTANEDGLPTKSY